jgi:hypothetical protein
MNIGVMIMIETMAEEDGMTRSGMIAYLARKEWAERAKLEVQQKKNSKKG